MTSCTFSKDADGKRGGFTHTFVPSPRFAADGEERETLAMLLRAIAVVVSLLIHGLIGYAIWPRLQLKELEVLDLGKGPDIVLTPQGSAISEMTNRGDNVASIEAQEVVPIEQRQTMPQPEAVEPLERLHDVANDVENNKTQEVVAVQEQKPTLQSPTVKAARTTS